MINRYHGNSGKVTRIEEPGHMRQQPPPEKVESRNMPNTAPVRRGPVGNTTGLPSLRLSGIFDRLGRILPGGIGNIGQLETEDIILLLILYLMYRESGDSELLMIMGAMFLL